MADISALRSEAGALLGYIFVYHLAKDDEVARDRYARRARLVRRLTDVVGDINAELELPAVLDRIAASLTELTGADAGGFVLIEGERLRLVSGDRLPDAMRGVTGELRDQPRRQAAAHRQDRAAGDPRRGRPGRADLVAAARPQRHRARASPPSAAGRTARCTRCSPRANVGHVELELLELLAAHAGIAVGNALSYQEAVRQRAHQRAVFDASADGIAVLDAFGRVRAVEPGRGASSPGSPPRR